MAFFGMFKTKREREIEQFARDINDPRSEINKLRNEALKIRNDNQQINVPREGQKLSTNGLRLDNYELCIPQGIYLNSGHVRLEHNIHYSIIMRNFSNISCDADVSIDGRSVALRRFVWDLTSQATVC